MEVKTKLSMREASGAISLVIIILFVQVIIFIIQPQAVKEQFIEKETATNHTEEDSLSIGIASTFISPSKVAEKSPKSTQSLVAKFKFDPNSISEEGLVELGLSPRQAAVIIRYRTKGGVFKTKEDLKKIYVLPDGFYERVKDSIFIESTKNSCQELHANISNHLGESNYSTNQTELSIELNQADSISLLNLPGIGPYYASKIIEYRKKVGGLTSKEQLMEIKGIDSSRYAMFAHLVFADTLKIIKKDLNKVTISELSRNPYIGSYLARTIIRFRELSGKDGITLTALVLNKIMPPELSRSLRHYFY
ncbi:MAG: helix-hairpin-helix domain-containing protein [Bacteroidales bacterium]